MSSSMNTILVIGGTSGIGEAFVRRFHSMGKKVIVTGRREAKIDELKRSLTGLEGYPMDNNDLASIPSHVETLFSKFPQIDTVWINSGIQLVFSFKDISSTTDNDVVDEITTNVTSPILLARHIIPRLLASKAKETNFLITSSGLGYVPASPFPVYCPTKSAMHYFMVGLRQQLKETNVNVIEIVPPYVGGTELGVRHQASFGSAKPLPMSDFIEEQFKVLDSTPAKEIKEIAAGTAGPRVAAWRDSIGKILETTGLGG